MKGIKVISVLMLLLVVIGVGTAAIITQTITAQEKAALDSMNLTIYRFGRTTCSYDVCKFHASMPIENCLSGVCTFEEYYGEDLVFPYADCLEWDYPFCKQWQPRPLTELLKSRDALAADYIDRIAQQALDDQVKSIAGFDVKTRNIVS